jgi:hypothetical protein
MIERYKKSYGKGSLSSLAVETEVRIRMQYRRADVRGTETMQAVADEFGFTLPCVVKTKFYK